VALRGSLAAAGLAGAAHRGSYRAMAGDHPDRDEYRAAMVAERRLLLKLRFDYIHGWIQPSS